VARRGRSGSGRRRSIASRARLDAPGDAAPEGDVRWRQLDYRDPARLLALRQQIAEHVRRVRGASCSADQVVVVTGAQHGCR
jgi:DNA-binding transcriptional MocR family regulator